MIYIWFSKTNSGESYCTHLRYVVHTAVDSDYRVQVTSGDSEIRQTPQGDLNACLSIHVMSKLRDIYTFPIHIDSHVLIA